MAGSIRLDRRSFLRGTGVAMALPMLECMAKDKSDHKAQAKRMFCVGLDFGLYPNEFFPKNTGLNYTAPALIKPLQKHRSKFTVFSGLDHTGVNGGHRAVCSYLTAVDTTSFPGHEFKNTISIDQLAAEKLGSNTRFPSIQVACGANTGGLSWTRQGITINPINQPVQLFNAMFKNDSEKVKNAKKKAFDTDNSILDVILDEAKDLNRRLGKYDKEKMDEYLTAVRDIEKKLQINKAWIDKPKPKISQNAPEPINSDNMFEAMPLMYELATLAFKSNSTRFMTFHIPTGGNARLDGVTTHYHALSHHGKSQKLIDQLLIIERQHSIEFAKFLDAMASYKEMGKSLLDDTVCLYGGGMGNASSHSNRNLPILLAGGGFKHKGHLRYEKTKSKATPLGNLYVTMLQQLGIGVDRFGISNGVINGFA